MTNELTNNLDLDARTAAALSRFAKRRRLLLLVRAAAAAVVAYAALMTVIALIDYFWLLPDGARWILSLIGYATTACIAWSMGLSQIRSADVRSLARKLESTDPGLREHLLSAVELADPKGANGSDGFRRRLQKQVAQRISAIDVGRLIPFQLIRRWLLASVFVVAVVSGMLLIPQVHYGRRMARAMLPGVAIERASSTELTIVQPSPPGGFVPEGDAVAVIAKVAGEDPLDVWLQWRSNDGTEGESLMSSRSRGPTEATGQAESFYAANVAVGTRAIDYRVLAGDAITLWHTLTPQPRPQAIAFEKQYRYPEYSELEPRVETEEHGDVKSLAGTLVATTITFDEPVRDATIRYGKGGSFIPLDEVGSGGLRFKAEIPIRTPTTYQVDAVSLKSGLNNPFGPRYTITPLVDHPPTIQWAEPLPSTLIVSPLDVLALRAIARDDLPMNRIIHEFKVNDDPVVRRDVLVSQASRELSIDWEWDLIRRDGPAAAGSDRDSSMLQGGDIVRMRVVAIDRNNQRGESAFVDVLIADQGFDRHRHAELLALRETAKQLLDWTGEVITQLRAIEKTTNTNQLDAAFVATVLKRTEPLIAAYDDVELAIRSSVAKSPDQWQGLAMERIGQAAAELRRELLAISRSVKGWIATDQVAADPSTLSELAKSLHRQSRNAKQLASRMDSFTRGLVGEALAIGLIDDAMSLYEGLEPMRDKEDPLPAERFARYLKVTVGRLQAMDELIDQHYEVIPDSTVAHLGSWRRFADAAAARLTSAIDEPTNVSEMQALVESIADDLKRYRDQSLFDGRLPSLLSSGDHDLRFELRGIGDRLLEMERTGSTARRTSSQAGRQADSAKVAERTREQRDADAEYRYQRIDLLDRIDRTGQLHRLRPNFHLQYAADLDLVRRAVTHVTADGFTDYGEQSADQVHRQIARAFQVLEATHELQELHDDLLDLMQSERAMQSNATDKIRAGIRVERLSRGLQWPVATLRRVDVDADVISPMNDLKGGKALNDARQRLNDRRWKSPPYLSAEFAVEALATELDEIIGLLDPKIREARETLRKYVLTLPEQALEAAQKAQQSSDQTSSRKDNEERTVEQLQQTQRQAEDAAEQTIDQLMNVANTIDVSDAKQRQLAIDADIAAAKIEATKTKAANAMESAARSADPKRRHDHLDEAAAEMEQLAETLEVTAEHFQAAQEGRDLASTRQQIRSMKSASEIQQQLQQSLEDAEAIAESSQRSPEALLQRLEEELAQNEPMQQELSEISAQAAENAQLMLEQAAADEAALNESIERADEAFEERKRRLRSQLERIGSRATAINNALVNSAIRGADWGQAETLKPPLRKLESTLRDTAQRGRNAGRATLLRDLQQQTQRLDEVLQEVSRDLEAAQQAARQSEDQPVYQNKQSRQRARQQLERLQRDARGDLLNATTTEEKAWQRIKRDAGSRIQLAERRQRSAKSRFTQLEEQIRNHPEREQNLQPALAQAGRQLQAAELAEQAARKTSAWADERTNQLKAQADALRKQRLDELKKENPAAELAKRMTEQAEDAIKALQQEVRQLVQDSQFQQDLRVADAELDTFQRRQQDIQTDVELVEAQLRRAARHEQRLGKPDLAKQLEQAAQEVSQRAADATAQAAEAIEQAMDDQQQTPRADRQVTRATEALREAAGRVQNLLTAAEQAASDDGERDQAISADSSLPDDPQQPDQQRQAQQLARTLDELDRALSGESQLSAASESRSSESSSRETQTSSADSTGESESAEASSAGGQPGSPADKANASQNQSVQPPTAGEVSPTLQQSLQQQARQAARRRQQQLQPGDGTPGDPTSEGSSPSEASASNPGSQPGSGTTPDGGVIETESVDRRGDEWGNLRERRFDETSQRRGPSFAPQYRREIEAYFRAISQQAAESE